MKQLNRTGPPPRGPRSRDCLARYFGWIQVLGWGEWHISVCSRCLWCRCPTPHYKYNHTPSLSTT